MTYGSLFTGIGGLDLGLDRAGWECRWQVEAKPFCRMILRQHWPSVPKYRDVHQFPPRKRMPVNVDMICGGFPCQDASVANVNGKGINGTRTGLWTEFARIVGIFRPHFVLVENVPGLLRRGFGRVIGDLASLGYDAEWDCLPASAFGAPHRRDRLWIIAYAQRTERGQASTRGCGLEKHDNGVSGERDQDSGRACGILPPVADALWLGFEQGRERARRQAGDQSGRCGKDMADAASGRQPANGCSPGNGRHTDVGSPVLPQSCGAGLEGRRVFGPAPDRVEWLPEPDVCRVAHGVPDGVHRLEALGNAVVPVVGEWLGRRILETL